MFVGLTNLITGLCFLKKNILFPEFITAWEIENESASPLGLSGESLKRKESNTAWRAHHPGPISCRLGDTVFSSAVIKKKTRQFYSLFGGRHLTLIKIYYHGDLFALGSKLNFTWHHRTAVRIEIDPEARVITVAVISDDPVCVCGWNDGGGDGVCNMT
jgi:hypothetical protein